MMIDVIALKWGVAILIFFIVCWIILARKLLRTESKRILTNMADNYKELSIQELSKYGIDKEDFQKFIYEKFVEIHMALTNYDYEVLKKNLTFDLYNYYVSEIKKFNKRRYRNVMNDIELLGVKIYRVTKEFEFPSVCAYLNVRMYDYLLDMDTLKCIVGTDSEKVDLEFELIFEKRNINSPYVMSKKICINKMNKLKKENE